MEVLGTVGVIESLTRPGKQRLDVFPYPLGPITDDAQAHLVFRKQAGLFELLEGLAELLVALHLMPTKHMDDALTLKQREVPPFRVTPLSSPLRPLGPRVPASLLGLPSAVGTGRHLVQNQATFLGIDQMCFTLTAIVGIDPRFQFVGTQQTVWFRDGPLPMDPFRFNRVKPRTFAGQGADDDAYTDGAPFDLLVVLAYPVAHGLAAVPGRVVPDNSKAVKPCAASWAQHHAKNAIVTALTGRPVTNRRHICSSCGGGGRTSNP